MIQASLKFIADEKKVLKTSYPYDEVQDVLFLCNDIMSDTWVELQEDTLIKNLRYDLIREHVLPGFTSTGVNIIKSCLVPIVKLRWVD
jgi:hypothetical protein